jgi:hypothetical protein
MRLLYAPCKGHGSRVADVRTWRAVRICELPSVPNGGVQILVPSELVVDLLQASLAQSSKKTFDQASLKEVLWLRQFNPNDCTSLQASRIRRAWTPTFTFCKDQTVHLSLKTSKVRSLLTASDFFLLQSCELKVSHLASTFEAPSLKYLFPNHTC